MWKWRRSSQFASGRTNTRSPQARNRWSSHDDVKAFGKTILISWKSTMAARASGRTSGSPN